MPPGHAAELYRWVDEQGHVSLSDTPPPSQGNRQDLKVYRPETTSPPPESRETPAGHTAEAPPPATTPGGIMVEAVVNGRLTVPLRLDTGAELTVLTKAVAEALPIAALEHLPRHAFKTAGGPVTMPVASLRSLRIGSTEARDVTVAIDLDGRMPVGLLGMSFLRRFKVTVDQQQGRVTFDR